MPFKRFDYRVQFLFNYLQPVFTRDSSHVRQLQVRTAGVKESTGLPCAGGFYLVLINLILLFATTTTKTTKKSSEVKQASKYV